MRGFYLTCFRVFDTSWLSLESDGHETGGNGFKNKTRLLARVMHNTTKYALDTFTQQNLNTDNKMLIVREL